MSEQQDDSHDMSDEQKTEAMTAYAEPAADHDDDLDYQEYDEFGDDASLPGRPRRVLINRYSVGLLVILVGAACFYGGVRIEKSKVGTSGTSAGGIGALASRFSALSGASASKSGTSSAAGASGFGGGRFAGAGGAGGFAGGRGAPGAGTEGTISSINGDTIYITEASGDTVKVKLNSATTLTKTVTVGKRSLYPGDTVSVTGASSGGTVTATSVADSGAGSSSTSSTSGASSSGTSGSSGTSSSSGATGLSSLFGGN